MPRETSEMPESILTYLSQVAEDGVVKISGDFVPTPVGPFRAIGSLVLGKGWSGLEPWGVWSDGDSAVVYLKNPLTTEDPGSAEVIGEVTFEARAAVSEKHPKLPVRLQIGSSIVEFVFSWPSTAHARIKVPVPAELGLAPVLRVEMVIVGPAAPYEQTGGQSSDHRLLGIGIESAQVQPCSGDSGGFPYTPLSDHQGVVEPAERQRPAAKPIPGGRSNVIAITMVYNEGDALRRWLRHYGRHVGERNLLILDDGSDDGSTDDVGAAGRISVPRKLADDGERADFVSDLQRALLRYYDAVIYTDCDEFLVPNPRRFANIREYVDQMTADCVRPVAFNVIQIRDKEPALDNDQPILDQRAYCRFYTPECKPSLAKVPIHYEAGFHHCNRKTLLDPELLLVHSKFADFSAALARLSITRNMRWSDRAIQAGWGNHSRAEDDHLTGGFDAAERFLRDGQAIDPLDPENLARMVNAQIEEQSPPYRCPQFHGPLSTVPDWLRGAV